MSGHLLTLAIVALLATIVVLAATFRQVVRAAPSPRLLLRLYLEVAAFTGALFLVVELSGPLQWLLASAFGLDAIYGSAPAFQSLPPNAHCLPPDAPICQPADVQLQLWLRERERLNLENLERGAVFASVAAVFGIGHLALRSLVLDASERGGILHRAHLIVGLLTFGFVTALYLPNAALQLVDRLAYPDAWSAHGGAGTALPFGLASLVVWIAYAALLMVDLRPARAPAPHADPDAIPVWR